MADKKISELVSADALSGAELIEVVQGGVNKRTTPQAIADLVPSSPSNFLGLYTSLANLESAHATASSGNWAIVDPGSGTDAVKYLWDEDEGWVSGGSGAGVLGITGDGVDNTDPANPVISNGPIPAEFSSVLTFNNRWIVRETVMTGNINYSMSGLQQDHCIIEDYITGDGTHSITFPDESDGFFNTNDGVFQNHKLNRIVFYRGLNGVVTYTIENLNVVSGLITLDTPENLFATPFADEIQLEWDAVTNADSYDVQVSDTGTFGTWSVITNTTDTTFGHAGIGNGVTKHYRVQAKGDGVTYANSAFTSSVSATTGSGGSTLSTPSLSLSNIDSITNRCTWSNVAGEESYSIERSPNGSSSWSVIATPAANETIYDDDTCTPEVQYYYRVKAIGNGSTTFDSGYSTVQEIITNSVLTPGLTLTSGDGEISVQITNIDPNVDSIVLQRSTSSDYSGAVSVEEYTSPNDSVLDEGLTIGTTYYYRARVTVNGINSAYGTGSAEAVNSIIEFDLFSGGSIDSTLWPTQVTTGGTNSINSNNLLQTCNNLAGGQELQVQSKAFNRDKMWIQTDFVDKQGVHPPAFRLYADGVMCQFGLDTSTYTYLRIFIPTISLDYSTTVPGVGKTLGILIDNNQVSFWYWDSSSTSWVQVTPGGNHTITISSNTKYAMYRCASSSTGITRQARWDNFYALADKPLTRYPV